MVGATGATDIISFGSPITNPVIAIWSLGANGNTASFNFEETPTIVAGGPSAEYNGSSIILGAIANAVYGAEGNGSVVFYGTFSSITWTNPSYENWYGFTVGAAGSTVPEPSTWAMLGLGFAALGLVRLRGSARPRAA